MINVQEFKDESMPSGFLNPLFVKEIFSEEIEEIVKKFKGRQYFFFIGIGGSNLATMALFKALGKEGTDRKVYFIESLDESEYKKLSEETRGIQDIQSVCIIVSSKSGDTRETLDSFQKIYDNLEEKFGENIKNEILIITGEMGKLKGVAQRRGIQTIPWQGDIGGRYSAFTRAHTIPLAILGIDTNKILTGARNFINSDIEIEKIEKLAKRISDHYKQGVNILDIFTFNSKLEELGKWSRQLVAESLGKENKLGQRIGLTPTISVGPRDLHSMLELYLAGPRNRFTIFLYSTKEAGQSIEKNSYQDTLSAYQRDDLPFEKFEMEEINEESLGKFFAYMMLLVVSLAKEFSVNPYDQQAVEEYKKNLN
jgi:glucose-6-phosphate isomerase